GEGLSAAGDSRQYDRDGYKNFMLRLSQAFGSVRVGAFGYRGEESADQVISHMHVVGPDATIDFGDRAQVNLQAYRRWDDDPFLGACSATAPCPSGFTQPTSTRVDAAMGELLFFPKGQAGRWTVAGLWNWIDASAPVVSLRLGEQGTTPGFLRRYQEGGIALHYLLRRNLRLMGEGSWDFVNDQAHVLTGVTLAF
ncbi:MAG TPA: hypothetical protein VFV33_02030, partial [Gemmatimonadaceae bacterium]|nr:hypothetical protein [Gemmatimonadaceae bacterium]